MKILSGLCIVLFCDHFFVSQALNSIRSLFNTGTTASTEGLSPVSTEGLNPIGDPPPGVDPAYFNRPGPWDDKNLGTLKEANRIWAERMRAENSDFFVTKEQGHSPKILWIGCSDARVPANEIIGEPPGSVFVHRNVANMVVNTDFNCLSVLQYAVDVLKVKHIVVCGHYDCGGVKAALSNVDHKAPLENWLRNIRDIVRLHRLELNRISDVKDRQYRLVELNVMEQCVNIFKTGSVQKRRLETSKLVGVEGYNFKFAEPRVHAFVFDPTSGNAKRLDINFLEIKKELREVYELYEGAKLVD